MILEAIVVATIILAGVYVGYYAWQESLHAPDYDAHALDPSVSVASAPFDRAHSPISNLILTV